MKTQFTPSQKRALAIVTGIALLFGAYFLRRYFLLLVIAAIVAYLFSPLYNRLNAKIHGGLATTLTVLAALATVVIPVTLVISLATVQISHMLMNVGEWAQTADLNALGDKAITMANQLLAKLPFKTPGINLDALRDNFGKVARTVGEWLLRTLSGAAGGAIGFITSAIIFLYVLISLLVNKTELITLVRRLNPLGEDDLEAAVRQAGAGKALESLAPDQRRQLGEAAKGSVRRALAALDGDGLARRAEIVALLDSARAGANRKFHVLADRIARPGNDEDFGMFIELAGEWLAGRVEQAGAHGDSDPARLARLAEVWEKISRLAAETETMSSSQVPGTI